MLRIWTRSRTDPDVERLIVDPEQFPQGDTTLALGALAMSPDGEQIAYQRYSENGGYRIWISRCEPPGRPCRSTTGLLLRGCADLVAGRRVDRLHHAQRRIDVPVWR